MSTFPADEISGSSDTEIRLQETFAICKEIRNQDPTCMSVKRPVDPTPLLVSCIPCCHVFHILTFTYVSLCDNTCMYIVGSMVNKCTVGYVTLFVSVSFFRSLTIFIVLVLITCTTFLLIYLPPLFFWFRNC